MQFRSLKNIPDAQLLTTITRIQNHENRAIAEIVLHLSELDARGLYRDQGYSSLFAYCTECLGYSEGAAFRRIKAARALKDNPEIYDRLRDGKLSLCAVTEISKVADDGSRGELLSKAVGQSKAEVQKMVAQYSAPAAPLRRERVTARKVQAPSMPVFDRPSGQASPVDALPLLSPVRLPPAALAQGKQEPVRQAQGELRYTITLEVDEAFMQLINEAKEFAGAVPMTELLRRTVKEFVARRKRAPGKGAPAAKRISTTTRTATVAVKSAKPAKPKPNKNKKMSRYIPKAIAREVRERDNHRCTFVSADGKRCSEARGLQIDHVKPFALGGSNEAENLRVVCGAHNRLLGERVFGNRVVQDVLKVYA